MKFELTTPKMRLEETLALTPALSPRRGGSTQSARKFSGALVWHRFKGTHVGCYGPDRVASGVSRINPFGSIRFLARSAGALRSDGRRLGRRPKAGAVARFVAACRRRISP